jgi:hypothetical protein
MIPSPVVAQGEGEAPYPPRNPPVTSRDEFASSRYSTHSDSDQTSGTHTGSTLLDHGTSLEGTDETLVNYNHSYSHGHNLGYGHAFGHGQGLGAWKGTLKQVEEEQEPPSYRGSVESGSVIFAGSNAVVPPRHARAGAGAGPEAIARGSRGAGGAGDAVDEVDILPPGREEMLDSPGSAGTFGRGPAAVVGGTRLRGRLRDNMI